MPSTLELVASVEMSSSLEACILGPFAFPRCWPRSMPEVLHVSSTISGDGPLAGGELLRLDCPRVRWRFGGTNARSSVKSTPRGRWVGCVPPARGCPTKSCQRGGELSQESAERVHAQAHFSMLACFVWAVVYPRFLCQLSDVSSWQEDREREAHQAKR